MCCSGQHLVEEPSERRARVAGYIPGDDRYICWPCVNTGRQVGGDAALPGWLPGPASRPERPLSKGHQGTETPGMLDHWYKVIKALRHQVC